MTSSVVGPRRSSKALSKARLAPEKVTVTVWWSASLIHYSFLNPCETIISEKYAQQIGEMQWKLQPLQSTFLVIRKGPVLLHDSGKLHIAQPVNASKVEQIWLRIFASSAIFYLSSHYHFFKHLDNFLQGKCFHNQQKAEDAFHEFMESCNMDFYATGINSLISCWQKCIDCNGSDFD